MGLKVSRTKCSELVSLQGLNISSPGYHPGAGEMTTPNLAAFLTKNDDKFVQDTNYKGHLIRHIQKQINF